VAHYQPILNLQTGHCVGMEVLMRWKHPVRGLIPPLAFIPEAERTGLITQLTECMMVRALEELALGFCGISPPACGNQYPRSDPHQPILPSPCGPTDQRKFSYKNISFELTESTSLTDAALVQLRVMKDLGIRLAVDDFGTGYFNLRYLSLFPFDFLKVDKAFVDGITTEGKSSGLVDQIVSIGRTCRMEMIAEGIEKTNQAEYLKSIGVGIRSGISLRRPDDDRRPPLLAVPKGTHGAGATGFLDSRLISLHPPRMPRRNLLSGGSRSGGSAPDDPQRQAVHREGGRRCL